MLEHDAEVMAKTARSQTECVVYELVCSTPALWLYITRYLRVVTQQNTTAITSFTTSQQHLSCCPIVTTNHQTITTIQQPNHHHVLHQANLLPPLQPLAPLAGHLLNRTTPRAVFHDHPAGREVRWALSSVRRRRSGSHTGGTCESSADGSVSPAPRGFTCASGVSVC